MSKKSNTIDFISKSKIIHGEKFDYSLVNYVTAIKKIKIICPKHGIFEQTPNKHLCGRGCKKCANNKLNFLKTKSTELVIEEFNEIHNFKYDYTLVNYKTTHNKVIIICKKHGKFLQAPSKHLMGSGCPKCGFESISKKIGEKPTGWSLTNWIKTSRSSKNFDSFKVYIIKCWNEDEEFYKIGRTFTKISKRFKAIGEMPYNYKIIKIYEDSPERIYKMEIELKNKLKENKYFPKNKFHGKHECFLIEKKEIEKLFSYVGD